MLLMISLTDFAKQCNDCDVYYVSNDTKIIEIKTD